MTTTVTAVTATTTTTTTTSITIPTWQEFIEENYDMLLKLCMRMTWDSDRAHIVMSDVVCERLPRILELFDPSYEVPLEAHVVVNVRWYIHKWLKKSDVHRERFEYLTFEQEDSLSTNEEEPGDWLECSELSARVMQALSEYDQTILLMSIVNEQTIRQLADQFGISVGLAHLHRTRALARAYDIAVRLTR